VAVLFLVMLVFHLSLSLARLHEKHTALVQEFGLLTATPAKDDPDAKAPERPAGAGTGAARRRS
jgi:hypothetical protein